MHGCTIMGKPMTSLYLFANSLRLQFKTFKSFCFKLIYHFFLFLHHLHPSLYVGLPVGLLVCLFVTPSPLSLSHYAPFNSFKSSYKSHILNFVFIMWNVIYCMFVSLFYLFVCLLFMIMYVLLIWGQSTIRLFALFCFCLIALYCFLLMMLYCSYISCTGMLFFIERVKIKTELNCPLPVWMDFLPVQLWWGCLSSHHSAWCSLLQSPLSFPSDHGAPPSNTKTTLWVDFYSNL